MRRGKTRTLAVMNAPRVLGRESRFLWFLAYLLAFIGATGVLMIANTTVFGLGDSKFGAAGWMIYWPAWGIVFLPPIFVASLLAEVWWRSTLQRLLRFFGVTLGAYLAAMEISFIVDIQWPALVGELVVLCGVTVLFARKWFAK